MKKSSQPDLFEKYLSGECSDQEKTLVEAWYLNELNTEEVRPSSAQLASAKKEIWDSLRPRPQFVQLKRWLTYAAVLAVVFSVVYRFTTREEGNEKLVEKNTENTLVASKVENTMMKLPDGSFVILEKGSSLSLMPAFNQKDKREVRLVGKAFFDVKHDAAKPFIIYSGDLKTTVLGTSFDIDAASVSEEVKINVIRGKVKVEHASETLGVLTKNMQIVYDAHTEHAQIKHIDAEKELAWNKQDVEFNDISLADAIVRLEEQFGYKILIKDTELGKQTFHYSMRAKESPESFIKSICAFIGANYVIDAKNRTILIQP